MTINGKATFHNGLKKCNGTLKGRCWLNVLWNK